jgi:uncharacterized repeat protein (TIGR01451 family)
MGTGRIAAQGLMVAVLLAVVVTGTIVQPVFAAGNNPAVKVAIHTKAHPTSCTKNYPTFSACNEISTTWPGTGSIDVMPVFYDLAEISGLEFGLTWPVEWYSISWVRCKGDVAMGTIRYSGEGTTILWTTCQTAWAQAPGYGWLEATGPGSVRVVPNPATNSLGVADCQPSPGPYYDWAVGIFYAGIGGTPGLDPCGVFPPAIGVGDSVIHRSGVGVCAFRGDTIIYTLHYENLNPGGISGVVLVDSLSGDATFISATGGGSFDSGTGLVTWNIGSVAGGDTGAVNCTVTVDPTAPLDGVITNNARIGCAGTTEISTGSTANWVCICMISGPTQVLPTSTDSFCAPEGAGFSYSWSISGNGSISGPANGRCVQVIAGSTCNMPYTLSLCASDGQGNVSWCEQVVMVDETEPPIITCAADKEVACGAPIDFDDPTAVDNFDPDPVIAVDTTYSHSGPGPGETTHTKCWTASDDCGNTSEPCCQNIVEDCSYLPLTITKDDDVSDCVHVGDSLTYTLSYGNPNDETVSYVIMKDHVPEGTRYVTSSGGVYYSGTRNVTWVIPTLAGHASGSRTLTIEVQADSLAGTLLGNDCWIVSNQTAQTDFHLDTQVCSVSGVEPVSSAAFALRAADPNPFIAITTIAFDLPAAGYVTLEVHDVQGRMVRRLTASEWPAGRHSVEWDGQDANGRDVPPGAYFVRIEALGRTGTAKVILAR